LPIPRTSLVVRVQAALDEPNLEYDRIRYWNGREELIYQVLLVNGVITIGSSETEVMRFPAEVRKADAIAGRILQVRAPELGAAAPRLRAVGGPR
jgi:hypothetical protein